MIFQHIDNYKTFENDIKNLSNEDDFETSCENIEEFLTQYYKKDLLYFFSQLLQKIFLFFLKLLIKNP